MASCCIDVSPPPPPPALGAFGAAVTGPPPPPPPPPPPSLGSDQPLRRFRLRSCTKGNFRV